MAKEWERARAWLSWPGLLAGELAWPPAVLACVVRAWAAASRLWVLPEALALAPLSRPLSPWERALQLASRWKLFQPQALRLLPALVFGNPFQSSQKALRRSW
jgi:hypothetical protein